MLVLVYLFRLHYFLSLNIRYIRICLLKWRHIIFTLFLIVLIIVNRGILPIEVSVIIVLLERTSLLVLLLINIVLVCISKYLSIIRLERRYLVLLLGPLNRRMFAILNGLTNQRRMLLILKLEVLRESLT